MRRPFKRKYCTICDFYQDKGYCLLFRGVSALSRCRVLPYLTYCHLVWKFCKSSDSRKIERIQESALRAVYKSQTETYKELLTHTKLSTLYHRRLQVIAILMYKVKYGIAPRHVSELFTNKSTHQCLRNCDFVLSHFDTVAYGRHSLHYQRPFIWSKVSSEIRNLTSLKAFKKHIQGVDLLSHKDNNSNCCDLCKFCIVDICILF